MAQGRAKLPTFDKQDSRRNNNITGTTNFTAWGTIGGTPDLAGPATPADLELWRKHRAEKVGRGEDPGNSMYPPGGRPGADLEYIGAIAREREAKKSAKNEKLKKVFHVGGKGKEHGDDRKSESDEITLVGEGSKDGVIR
jgi:hypothetical protein